MIHQRQEIRKSVSGLDAFGDAKCLVCVLAAWITMGGYGAADDSDVLSLPAYQDDYAALREETLLKVYAGVSTEVLAREALTGSWQVMFLEQDGVSNPELATRLQMRIYRGRIELLQAGRPTRVVSYEIDLAPEPPRLNWKIPQTLVRQKGIYWLEGDILKICLGPVYDWGATNFLTQPGDGRTLFVLKRVENTVGAADQERKRDRS